MPVFSMPPATRHLLKFIKRSERASIGVRMASAFGLVLVLFACTTTYAVLQVHHVESEMSEVLDSSIHNSAMASSMRRSIDEVYINTSMLLLSKQVDEAKFYVGAVKKSLSDYDAAKKALFTNTQGVASQGLKEATAQIGEAEIVLTAIEQLVSQRNDTLERAGANQALESDETMIAYLAGALKVQFDFWVSSVDTLGEKTQAIGTARQASARASVRVAQAIQAGVSAASLIIGVLAAWLITRSVTRPIRYAVSVAERVAKGDLSIPIETGDGSETGALLDALTRMQDSLNSLVREVRDSAHYIANASSEVAFGNSDLSTRTENAASQLQQTVQSLNQLSEAVRQSAESACAADALARHSSSKAKQGGSVVIDAVQSMQGIASQSERIGNIIGVIEGIAFQTNILALNAAVEAARAGEQGRGFAVVASEVRNLAQRSATAAKDIGSLIQESVASVRSGTSLVQSAGHNMADIVTSVSDVTAAIEKISHATSSQSDDLARVSQTIRGIDELTQQNSALVEQSAAAADSLSAQSQRLMQLVETFRLSDAT